MTDRAKEISAEMIRQYDASADSTLDFFAQHYAMLCERVEALEARGKADYEIMHVPGLLREPMPSCQCRTCEALRKPNPSPAPVPQPGASRGAEVAALAAARQEILACIWGCHYDRTNAALDKLVGASRAQALEEAELKVLDHLDNAGPGCRITLRAAAAAVARLREGT